MTQIDPKAPNYISLGAGVQSTALALMAACGELTPMPDGAVFADTQWEPRVVYEHLAWLETQLPFPVYRCTAGSLKERLVDPEKYFSPVPFYQPPKTPGGRESMGRRQCTREFKITPLQREVRRLLGYRKYQRIPESAATLWIGISMDEVVRMRESRVKWIKHRWPLIELEMTRQQCKDWMAERGFPEPPRSACLGCPYKNNVELRHTRDGDAEEWAETIELERAMWESKGVQYIHASCVPLDEVDLDGEDADQMSLWGNECEGMCGL